MALNASAVEQRYPSDHEASWDAQGVAGGPGLDLASRAPITRSLSPRWRGWLARAMRGPACASVRYQCAEGEIPDTPLYS